MQRRTVLKNTAATLAGLTCLPAYAMSRPNATAAERAYGVQLFTIPKLVEADLPGTLALIAEIGYREVEFFGPYPFSAEATKRSWEQIKSMVGLSDNAFYGHAIGEVARMLADNGLTAPSMHADLISMRENLDALISGVAPLQPRYLIVPAISEGRDNLDAYKRLAEEFNAFGRRMRENGMKFAYHNHGYEHLMMDGVTPLDYLIEHTDPAYVQFELDVFWMTAAGADPVSYLRKFPGRFKLLHLKDASAPFRFSGDGQTPDQWFAGFPLMADPGDGVYDIPAILEAAEAGGAEHYFLERDLAPEPVQTLRNSFANLTA
ncbi:sugar phosphate isomerase/epimerase [Lewinella sp. JB7]|uniref:sugar phosphate isomerase/epimerase family protein n=1 Tax=Lewinella sp. JB7 TaxID=2962887 RepID=UPI0020C98F78|nr:sugar phosphate isomerase/epimerase [Lewinella sp. JB7]MCP9236397.1 sugar phosphate isomerase/epimerase [Lewinella sp. JB7]